MQAQRFIGTKLHSELAHLTHFAISFHQLLRLVVPVLHVSVRMVRARVASWSKFDTGHPRGNKAPPFCTRSSMHAPHRATPAPDSTAVSTHRFWCRWSSTRSRSHVQLCHAVSHGKFTDLVGEGRQILLQFAGEQPSAARENPSGKPKLQPSETSGAQIFQFETGWKILCHFTNRGQKKSVV